MFLLHRLAVGSLDGLFVGVDTDDDEQAIKRAYSEAVKEKNPDRGGDEEELKEVTEEYDGMTE